MAAQSPRIFVSHANADKDYVDAFVNQILFRGAGLKPTDLFYSSAADTGIGSGESLLETVRREALEASLIIALVTPTYQTRPVCVAELGAAWARGVLFPLMSPGMDRSELEGVLPGLLIKSSDEESVLDEISDRVSALGFEFTSASFGAGKGYWKSALRTGVSPADLTPQPTAGELAKLKHELEDTQNALDEALSEVEEQKLRNTKLTNAKTDADVREANLPANEHERFQSVLKEAEGLIKPLRGPVENAIWHQLSGHEYYLPNYGTDPDEHDAIIELDKTGRLALDPDTNEVVLGDGFREIEDALVAVRRLSELLNEDEASEEFNRWFRSEYGVPMDLSKRGSWDKLFWNR